jgi:5-methyltetrahydrofolate--homocysteine methyltransferase
MTDTLYQNVLDGNADAVELEVQNYLDAGIDPASILNDSLIGAMNEVGRDFEVGIRFVPEMLVAARAMQRGLAILKPYLIEADVKPVAKVVIGTVMGDLHDIGKNLVAMMMEGSGFEVVDLGVDVSPESYVKAVSDHKPDLVGLSALLTTTMPQMEKTILALEKAGVRQSVKIMVGGAPVTQEFADNIGADIFAVDASAAASKAKKSIEGL